MNLDFIPNQKRILIRREKVKQIKDNGRLYLISYQDNILRAMKELSANTYKVYNWLCFYKDYTTIGYSPEFISKNLNMCKDTARKAIQELIEKKYIIVNKDHYFFYENPELINTEDDNVNELAEIVDKLRLQTNINSSTISKILKVLEDERQC